jgi:photosystem II stability/assembly factor-like uncharacterized protein
LPGSSCDSIDILIGDNQGQVDSVLRQKTRTIGKIWAAFGLALLTIAVAAIGARGAIEGEKSTHAPSYLSLFGVAIRPNDGAIFAIGSKALMMASTDHGKTWIQTTLPVRDGGPLFQDLDLYSIRFAPDGKTAFIVGETGTILRSTDGAETWKRLESGTTKNLMKVTAIDAQNAIAVGTDGIIVRTEDGGDHWKTVASPKNIELFDVTFTDKNTGWIAGEFSTVMNSTDGGRTWNVVTGGNVIDFTIGPYFTINFIDAQHAVVGGLAGEMATSDDGGKTWKPSKLPDQVGAYAFAIAPASKKLWAAGTGGRTFAEAVGGQWQEVTRTTFNDITDIALNGNQGVMVGLNGTILLTDDAGEKWQAVQ